MSEDKNVPTTEECESGEAEHLTPAGYQAREATLMLLVEKAQLANKLLTSELRYNKERAEHLCHCAYCQKTFLKLDIQEHIRDCDQHPLTKALDNATFWLNQYEESETHHQKVGERLLDMRKSRDAWRDKYLGVVGEVPVENPDPSNRATEIEEPRRPSGGLTASNERIPYPLMGEVIK